MKKMKILVAVSFLFILSGCVGKTATVCKYEGSDSLEVVLEYDGDKLVLLEATQLNDFTELGFSEDELKEIAEEFAAQFEEIKGYEYIYKIDGNNYTETTRFVYEDVDFDDLIEKEIIAEDEILEDENGNKYVSYEMMLSDWEAQGLTCTKKSR